MINKERLEEIKRARKTILDEELFQKKCIFLYSFDELGYLDWLIEQAEKVEQLQRENERLQNQLHETKFLLEKRLQQAKAKAERYKHAAEKYREALKFYASGSHYSNRLYDYKIVLLDDGEKARQALGVARLDERD